jgi:protein gp37
MYRDFERWKNDPTLVTRSKTRFNDPLYWKEGHMIFTCSLSDFFIEQADEWRAEAWAIIEKTPQHFYQILTKRPERIEKCLPQTNDEFQLPYAPKNSIIMLSVSTQKEFDTMWPIMENLKRFWHFRIGLSMEPLLEPINMDGWLEEIDMGDEEHYVMQGVPDWVIVGGESGYKTGRYKYRRCEIDWLLNINAQCNGAGVPAFLKQLGSDIVNRYKLKHPHGGDATEWFFAPTGADHLRQFPDFMNVGQLKLL